MLIAQLFLLTFLKIEMYLKMSTTPHVRVKGCDLQEILVMQKKISQFQTVIFSNPISCHEVWLQEPSPACQLSVDLEWLSQTRTLESLEVSH